MRWRFLFAGVVTVVACSDAADYYIFSAQKFDAADACLDPYKPVEIVPGPGADGNCKLRCLKVGRDVLLSAMCGALPAIAIALDPNDPDCIAALGTDASCAPPATDAATDTATEDAGAEDADLTTDASEDE